MLRGMIFMDHMNFDIALKTYYKGLGKDSPRLDYNKLFLELTRLLPDVDFMKAYLFIPKPDEFLMQDPRWRSYYNWVIGMNNAPFTDVVEGRLVSRPVNTAAEKDIQDASTYYKVEKGTDINLAIHALSKAYFNSYDIGFFLSADTDYISIYEMLKRMGKLVVQVSIKGQNAIKIKPCVDKQIVIDDCLFSKCLREDKTLCCKEDAYGK